MKWKYVMLELNGVVTPVIFPADNLIHRDVAKGVQMALREKAWKEGGSFDHKVLSAGMIDELKIDGAYGSSETLGVTARREDTAIINGGED